MKILIVRPSPNKMNLNAYNLQEIGLAKALVHKGHICDVMYYCGKEKDHIEKIEIGNGLSIRILWLHGYGIFHEGIYPSLRKYISDYDIIQAGGYVGLTVTWLNLRYGNKVVNFQGPYYCEYCKGDIKKAKIWDNTLLRLVNKNKMVLGTKSTLATEYMKKKGFKNVTTIGVGLDLSNLQISDEGIYQNEIVKQIASQKDGRILLYIGAIEDRRDILFLLEISHKVKLNYSKENVKLLIIGKGKEEYVSECKNKISALNLQDDVIWYERLEQKYLKAVYEMADIFILPTKYEIYGMVILEAMYFGVPVITTYNGGSSTMFNRENGVICNSKEPSEWADEIVALFEESERYRKMKECAHETIAHGYTWDALAPKFLELYK